MGDTTYRLYIFIVIGLWIVYLGKIFHRLSISIRFQGSREWIIALWGRRQKCRVLWVTDIELARQVLQHSVNKGNFIEEKIATPAWAPVLSLESINGTQWQALRAHFFVLQKHLPSPQALHLITQNLLFTLDPTVDLDARAMVRLTVQSFVKWLFQEDWRSEWDFICEASWEWRKEIAMKGKANRKLKEKTIAWLIERIQGSSYASLFGEKWAEPEYYSIFMQPFILSPMINFGDIAVSMAQFPTLPLEALIHMRHPFPVLERYIESDVVFSNQKGEAISIPGNTQVFIPLDQMGKQIPYEKDLWTPFGAGPRKCMGSHYALAFFSAFTPYAKAHPRFVPEKNHRYSGRNNDSLSLRESIYQCTVLWKILRQA